MRFIAVFNRDGGTFRTMDVPAFAEEAERVFAQHGHEIECRPVDGPDLIAALQSAADDRSVDAILAGGGDGTISAAATIAFRTGKALAVLPAGTMNLFARTLKIPLDLHQALSALAAGQMREVDIATANGEPFVHQFSVGIHARLVRIRESMSYKSRWGKVLASFRAVAAAIVNPPRFTVDLRTPRGTERREASAINVSNNLIGEGHLPYADDVEGGVLGVYIAKPMTTAELLSLALGLFIGRWKQNPMISEREVDHLVLHFPRRKRNAQAVIDGELIALARSVDLRIHPRALKVIAPKIDVPAPALSS